MAYKKYLNINGKRYGPYYYESYRDKTGKIKKKYIKRESINDSKEKGVGIKNKTIKPEKIRKKISYNIPIILKKSGLIIRDKNGFMRLKERS